MLPSVNTAGGADNSENTGCPILGSFKAAGRATFIGTWHEVRTPPPHEAGILIKEALSYAGAVIRRAVNAHARLLQRVKMLSELGGVSSFFKHPGHAQNVAAVFVACCWIIVHPNRVPMLPQNKVNCVRESWSAFGVHGAILGFP